MKKLILPILIAAISTAPAIHAATIGYTNDFSTTGFEFENSDAQ